MRTLYIILALLLTTTTMVTHADNNIEAPDCPWDDEDTMTVTAIDSIPVVASPANAVVYDLQGRKVQAPQPGKIYIVAGRKMVWR